MRLLWFNLATDLDDPVLGFTHDWIRAAASRVGSVRVVTMRSGRLELPENVRVESLGKEKGYGRLRRVGRFYRIVKRLVDEERFDACFSHMNPLFTVLGARMLRAKGIPIATWYAHPSLTLTLKLAHRASSAMVTSLPFAYPYRRDKLHVIGQGIDVLRFSPVESRPEEPPMILCAGRISPVKDHETLLRAAALARHEKKFQIVILGSPARPSDEAYRSSLERLAAELGLADAVSFHAAVSGRELPSWYRRATLHVNLTPAGYGDKVALESMACGTPTLAANADYRETLGPFADRLLFPPGNAKELSRKIGALLQLTDDERARMGRELSTRVGKLHGLEGLAERLIEVLDEL
jgi:glycosyltransferase involved in cell wall biosynthesis